MKLHITEDKKEMNRKQVTYEQNEYVRDRNTVIEEKEKKLQLFRV